MARSGLDNFRRTRLPERIAAPGSRHGRNGPGFPASSHLRRHRILGLCEGSVLDFRVPDTSGPGLTGNFRDLSAGLHDRA